MDRNLLRWRWFKNPKTMIVWIWLLMSANIEDHDFEKDTIRRGQVATSRRSISTGTGLTENEVRTALGHLKSTGEITVRLMPKYQVISIVNYDLYQAVSTGKRTGNSPAGHRQITGNPPQSKNIKNGKNEKNVCVTTHIPDPADVHAYFSAQGLSAAAADKFLAYNQARGWKIGKNRIEDWQKAADMWIGMEDHTNTQQMEATELDDFGRPVRKEFK
jgi:hypothetical protein